MNLDNLDSIASIIGSVITLTSLVVAIFAWRFAVKSKPPSHVQQFTNAVEQLADAKAGAQLAGAQALVHLAEEWNEGRQVCIDALCAYVRHTPLSSNHPSATNKDSTTSLSDLRFADNLVREYVIRAIAEHLHRDARIAWHGCTFDFTGAAIDGCNLSDILIKDGTRISFREAVFIDGRIDFSRSRFESGVIDFTKAVFPGGTVSFTQCNFTGGVAIFRFTSFTGGFIDFSQCNFQGGIADFSESLFSGGTVSFAQSRLEGSIIQFMNVRFEGGIIDLSVVDSYEHPPQFNNIERQQPAELKLPQLGD